MMNYKFIKKKKKRREKADSQKQRQDDCLNLSCKSRTNHHKVDESR